MDTGWVRWVVAVIVVAGIVALLAWARNDPGVGGRFPDPPDSSSLVWSHHVL